MAVIAPFGRSQRAPGPVPFSPNTGPLYNAGLAALSEFAGNMGGALAYRDRELTDAYNATEIVKRSAQYSLDVSDATRRAAELRVSEPGIGPANEDGTQPMVSRLASPDEQEKFFQAEVGKLENQYGKWEKGIYGRNVSVEARTRLKNTMIAETAQQISDLRQVQRKRMMAEMEDRLAFGYQAAVQNGSLPQLHQLVEEASPILTEAKREQMLAGFDTDVQIEKLRRAAANDPDSVLDQAQSLQAGANVSKEQRGRLREVEDLARGIRYDRKTRTDKAMTALLEDAFKQAHEIPPDQFQQRLLQTVGITEEQRAYLMKTYLSAAELYQRTGVNPWTTTQDYASMSNIRLGILTHEVKSLGEINNAWMEGGKPNWSYSDWKTLTNEFAAMGGKETSGLAKDSPVRKMYQDQLIDLYATQPGDVTTITDHQGFNVSWNVLQGILSDPEMEKNPDKLEERWKGLTVAEKEKKSKEILKTVGWAMSFMPPPMFMLPDKTPQYPAKQEDSAGTAIVGNLGNVADMAPQIASDAEWEALPSGAYFKGPDGVLRQK